MKHTLFLFLVSISLSWAADPNRFESYSVAFTDPIAAEQMIRSMVGEDGTVAVDAKGQRVLVMTTDDRHARIAAMMRQLNVPPKNVRIDVSFSGGGETHESEASVTGDGSVIIENGVTHGTIKIQPKLINQTTTTSSDTMQTLMVASGREGTLRVGEDVPYLEWIVDYGVHFGVLTQRVNWQQVGSSLIVEPTIVGDGPMIRVRLTPQLSGLVDGNPLQTRFAQVATEVYVQDGQTFQIGGLDEHQDFYSHFLIGFSRSGRQQTLNISLTPHILDGSGAPGRP